jgi:putative ABC transport system permease protein
VAILRIAYKLLVNDRAKYAALLVGITFAVFLMIEMTSLFAGILSRSSATVINIGASIWVMDPAVQTAANSIPLPDYVQDEVRFDRMGFGLAVAEPLIEPNRRYCRSCHDQPRKMSNGSMFSTLRTPT